MVSEFNFSFKKYNYSYRNMEQNSNISKVWKKVPQTKKLHEGSKSLKNISSMICKMYKILIKFVKNISLAEGVDRTHTSILNFGHKISFFFLFLISWNVSKSFDAT